MSDTLTFLRRVFNQVFGDCGHEPSDDLARLIHARVRRRTGAYFTVDVACQRWGGHRWFRTQHRWAGHTWYDRNEHRG